MSDNGNLYAAIGYPPSPPYYNGRFSNGPVTVGQLASSFHAPLLDFAYGGATTGFGDTVDGGTQSTKSILGLPGMLLQVGATLSTITPIAPTSLFLVWGGPNDFFSGGSVTVAVDGILGIVVQLQSVGATDILVPGMPDPGLLRRRECDSVQSVV